MAEVTRVDDRTSDHVEFRIRVSSHDAQMIPRPLGQDPLERLVLAALLAWGADRGREHRRLALQAASFAAGGACGALVGLVGWLVT